VNNFQKAVAQWCLSGSQTCDFTIASPTLCLQCHCKRLSDNYHLQSVTGRTTSSRPTREQYMRDEVKKTDDSCFKCGRRAQMDKHFVELSLYKIVWTKDTVRIDCMIILVQHLIRE